MPHLFWHFLPNFVHRMSFFNPAPRHPKTSQDPKIPRYPKPDQQISQLRHIRVCLASSRCILPSHRMGQRRRRRRRRRMLEAGTSTVAVFESKMQSGSESENLLSLHHKVYQNAGVFCWCRFCCCKPPWNKIVRILSTITATAGELRPNSFQLFGFTLLWRWWTMMDDDGRWWTMMDDDGRWWMMMDDDGRWWMMDDCTVPQAAVRLKPALRLILIHPGQTSLGNTCCELTFLTVTGILSAAASRSLHQGYRRVRGFRHVTWSSYCGSKL